MLAASVSQAPSGKRSRPAACVPPAPRPGCPAGPGASSPGQEEGVPRPGWREGRGDVGLCKGCCAHCRVEAGASGQSGVRGVCVESAQLGAILPPAPGDSTCSAHSPRLWGHVAVEGHVGWHGSGRCYWHLVGRARGATEHPAGCPHERGQPAPKAMAGTPLRPCTQVCLRRGRARGRCERMLWACAPSTRAHRERARVGACAALEGAPGWSSEARCWARRALGPLSAVPGPRLLSAFGELSTWG